MPEEKRTMPNRWWIYQRERFPVGAHGPVILAFSLSAVSYSALLRGTHHLPGWKPGMVGNPRNAELAAQGGHALPSLQPQSEPQFFVHGMDTSVLD
jgi:hypothetical protein